MSFFPTRFRQLLRRVRSGSIEFDVTGYQKQLERINHLQDELRGRADDELRLASAALRRQARALVPRERFLCEAFALTREAAERVLGMRPYDVQMIAAAVLEQGKVVQMQTGEGKTLAAVLTAYLNALDGRGVHVLTFNDYLARRDAAWMGPLYRFLGLRVGCIQHGMTIAQRQAAYGRDVTYVTAKEAGFDFLRDQICTDSSQLVHRPFHYAIVDEADSILIDEARVPLVIAGTTAEPHVDVRHLTEIVRKLEVNADYTIDERGRNVNFTAAGLDRVEQMLAIGGLHEEGNLATLARLNVALQAETLLHRDVDYLVRDGRIELIDEFTGRVAENRRWPHGLQAAIEAKEGVAIQPDGAILNSITLQHFLQLYERLAGMTGTAEEAADELHEFYNLKVAVVPTHRPCIRRDDPDLVFRRKASKCQALVEEIIGVHRTGRPILVGTASVQESDQLAASLAAANVPCQVLNAKNDQHEAEIVAEAGALGAVTISTNMAGRGTDIRLGGKDQRDSHHVISLGGLYVLGSNRHESRRIDNQLRGRAGRQGDPGQSRFFVSLEDDLISRYGVRELVLSGTRTNNMEEPIDDPHVTRKIAHSQRVIEGESFEIRRTLRKYSSVIERQRRTLHDRRRAILDEKEPLQLLQRRDRRRFDDLQQQFGMKVMREIEKQITLFQINRCWADHLSHSSEIREQIHLFSMGGYNPLDEFHKQINAAFNRLQGRIDDEIVATFLKVHVSKHGIDLEKEGLQGPSSTWTYMINDTPMGDVLERFSRGIKRLVTRKRTS